MNRLKSGVIRFSVLLFFFLLFFFSLIYATTHSAVMRITDSISRLRNLLGPYGCRKQIDRIPSSRPLFIPPPSHRLLLSIAVVSLCWILKNNPPAESRVRPFPFWTNRIYRVRPLLYTYMRVLFFFSKQTGFGRYSFSNCFYSFFFSNDSPWKRRWTRLRKQADHPARRSSVFLFRGLIVTAAGKHRAVRNGRER